MGWCQNKAQPYFQSTYNETSSRVLVLRGYGRYFGEEALVPFDRPWEFVQFINEEPIQ